MTGFTIAINRSYKKGDERKEVTTYIECSYWINSAIAEYLRNGTLVQFSGDLGTNAWVDKNGDAQARITCSVQTIKILAWANAEGQGGAKQKEGKIVKRKRTLLKAQPKLRLMANPTRTISHFNQLSFFKPCRVPLGARLLNQQYLFTSKFSLYGW